MPGFRIHHQHLAVFGILLQIGGPVGDHTGCGTAGGKLNAGVQSTGKIIGDNQESDHCVFPPLEIILHFFLLYSAPSPQANKSPGHIAQI